MKRIMKVFVVMMVLLACVCVMGEKRAASAKVKRYKLTMGENRTLKTYAYRNARNIKITVSKKGIVSVGRGGFSYVNLQIRPKKVGKTTVKVRATLKNGRKQTYCYNVTVKGYDDAKGAFKKQNKIREEAGSEPLQWSDELYQFAKYRAKTSGFDYHKNLNRDLRDYFGDRDILSVGENLADSHFRLAINLWKGEPAHYQNMINKGYKSGAIYLENGCCVAIFSSLTSEEIKEAANREPAKTIITRKDSATGTLLSDCQFTIEKVSDGSLVCSVGISSSKTETSTRKLVPGETYKVYEVITPTGYKKAKPITFTVTEGTNYITMTD